VRKSSATGAVFGTHLSGDNSLEIQEFTHGKSKRHYSRNEALFGADVGAEVLRFQVLGRGGLMLFAGFRATAQHRLRRGNPKLWQAWSCTHLLQSATAFIQ
jgi:hypothetical protein